MIGDFFISILKKGMFPLNWLELACFNGEEK